MASDNLNQIGKYIGKTGKDSDRALKRAYPIQPRIERIRDVFDEDIPFEMSFYLQDNDERVLLDLFFNLPPPIRGCKSGCIFTKCEEFTFESGGNHYITLLHPYLSGSVSVFVNNEKLSDGQVNENSPTAGEMYYQGTDGPDEVSICYVYTECPADDHLFNCEVFLPTIPSALLVFADRFDRTPTIETWGGLGFWHFGGLYPFTPVVPPMKGGAFDTGGFVWNYNFEGYHDAGVVHEVVTAEVWNRVGGLSNNDITLFKAYRFKTAGSGWQFGTVQQTFSFPYTFPIANSIIGNFYTRYVHSKDEVKYKTWLMSEPEPVAWTAVFDKPLPGIASHTVEEWYDVLTHGGTVGGGTAGTHYILGVQHWVTNTGAFGAWTSAFGESAYSWEKTTSKGPGPYNPSGIYFRLDDSVDAITQFGTGDIDQEINEVHPRAENWYTSDFFNDNSPLKRGSYQTVVSFTTEFGHVTTVRIEGQVRWRVFDIYKVFPPFTIYLMAFQYGVSNAPPQVGQWFDVTPGFEASIGAANAGEDWVGEWTDFILDVPVNALTHMQWGAKLALEATPMQDYLGRTPDGITPGSLLRNTEFAVEFQNLTTMAIAAPIGPARSLCPAPGTLTGRCSQFADTLNNRSDIFNYACQDEPRQSVSSSGQVWDITKAKGSKISIGGGSILTEYRANGLTDNGSDGRCAYTSISTDRKTSAGASLTSSRTIMSIGNNTFGLSEVAGISSTPLTCGDAEVFLQFKVGELGDAWLPDGEPDNPDFYNTPSAGLRMLPNGPLGSQSVDMVFSSSPSVDGLYATGLTGTGSQQHVIKTYAPNTLYSFRAQLTKDVFRVRTWASDQTEPATWEIQGIRFAPYTNGAFSLRMDYFSFIDDNFYIEVFSPSVTTIETPVV